MNRVPIYQVMDPDQVNLVIPPLKVVPACLGCFLFPWETTYERCHYTPLKHKWSTFSGAGIWNYDKLVVGRFMNTAENELCWLVCHTIYLEWRPTFWIGEREFKVEQFRHDLLGYLEKTDDRYSNLRGT